MLNDLYAFEIGTRTWHTIIPDRSPVPRHSHSANVVNGKLVIFGGSSFFTLLY